MDKKNIKNQEKDSENSTEYGEFIPSYYAWETLEHQKKTTHKLEEITKKDNK